MIIVNELLLLTNLKCQEIKTGFIFPVKIPIYLSANYAELRNSHFHSGIDIKTQGKSGIPVCAIEDGYISRIKTSSVGYGNSLYIEHPNGYTSVYGHLESYEKNLQEYIKNIQYKNRSFEINHFPVENLLPVKKGDVIGYSGNSGNSFGPHLHFEIRDTKTEIPLNPMRFYNITDNIQPNIYSVLIYHIDKNPNKYYNIIGSTKYNVIRKGNSFVTQIDTLTAMPSFFIGVEVYDYINNSTNKCGIASIEMYLNEELYMQIELDNISFNESHYIYSYIDYEQNLKTKSKIHRLYIEPNNRLSVYKNSINNGIIAFYSDSIVKIRIICKDLYGNASEVGFFVKNNHKSSTLVDQTKKNICSQLLLYNQPNTFHAEDVNIYFPENALFDTVCFIYSKTQEINLNNQLIYNIYNESIPINKKYTLSIKPKNIPDNVLNKSVICRLSDEEGGKEKFESFESNFNDNYITAYPNSFGKFIVIVDTVPPEIKPNNFYKNSKNDFSSKSGIEFIVTDNISEIMSYNGFIDEKWVLFQYDKKNDLLFYNFDEKRMGYNCNHKLKLIVADYKQNIEIFEMPFYK